MSRIKIIATPPGSAPDWVRKAWVDIELDTVPSSGGLQVGARGDALQNGDGYCVPALAAVEALAKKNPSAAKWFVDRSVATAGSSLVFARHVCKEI